MHFLFVKISSAYLHIKLQFGILNAFLRLFLLLLISIGRYFSIRLGNYLFIYFIFSLLNTCKLLARLARGRVKQKGVVNRVNRSAEH